MGVLVSVCIGVDVAVGVIPLLAVGTGSEVKLGMGYVVTVEVAVGSTATDMEIGAEPHPASSKRLMQITMLLPKGGMFILVSLGFIAF